VASVLVTLVDRQAGLSGRADAEQKFEHSKVGRLTENGGCGKKDGPDPM